MTLLRGKLRLAIPAVLLAVAAWLLWWHGPDWHAVGGAFVAVEWIWVIAAIGLNLVSVIARAGCWHTTIRLAMPGSQPRFSLVFSAFCVGLPLVVRFN